MNGDYHNDWCSLLVGDVRARLADVKAGSVQCCVTSPPYWGLRDYGVEGQLGLEPTPEEFVTNMVSVFREVWRVLRDDGCIWVNMGDSYATTPTGVKRNGTGFGEIFNGRDMSGVQTSGVRDKSKIPGIKAKDLVGVPWMLAFALRADGWYLRSEIIWHKPNPMPESVTDRPSKAHEQVFLLAKRDRYYFDQEAVREESSDKQGRVISDDANGAWRVENGRLESWREKEYGAPSNGRNLRSVWTIPTQSFSEAHFATYPEKLVEPCIKAGTSEKGCCEACGAPYKRVVEKERRPTRPGEKTKVEGPNSRLHISRDPNHPTELNGKTRLSSDVTGNRDPERHVTESRTVGWEPTCKCGAGIRPCIVLDPFTGSGTTGLVSRKLGRHFIGTELSETYAEMAWRRMNAPTKADIPRVASCAGQLPLFTEAPAGKEQG